jgi:periplasmic protein TonB
MVPVQDTSRNSRRAFAFFVVLAVHVLLFWGFSAGLTDIIKEKILGDIKTVDIAPPKEDELKPPPPPPKLDTTPPPFVPPPDIDIEMPVAETTAAIQSVTTTRPVETAPTAPVHVPVDVAPKINPRRPPGTTDEFYPPSAKRRGEEGTIVVQLHVLESGKVDQVEVKTSSGFPSLDEGAVGYVKTWQLLPGTRDGKPIATWWSIKVTFKIKG